MKTFDDYCSIDFTDEELLDAMLEGQLGLRPQVRKQELLFLPNWENEPELSDPILSLQGTPILTQQNMSAIIAPPGIGKSSICEAIAASALNAECDCLGFSITEDCKGVILVDSERTKADVWHSFQRMCNRAGIVKGEKVTKAKLAGLRAYGKLDHRMKAITFLLENNPCSLLLIDGVADLVTDTNDLNQAMEVKAFLRELTNTFGVSIFTTLHPNPGSFRPRGHLGSEIQREAECVLLAKKVAGGGRVITSEFEHGKNRNYGTVEGAYKWDNESSMFIGTNVHDMKRNNSAAKQASVLKECENLCHLLPVGVPLRQSKVISAIQPVVADKTTAKRKIAKMVELKLIAKEGQFYFKQVQGSMVQ